MKTAHDPEFMTMLAEDLSALTEECPPAMRLTGISEPDPTLQWLQKLWPNLTTADIARVVNRIRYALGPIPLPGFWQCIEPGLKQYEQSPAVQAHFAEHRRLFNVAKPSYNDGPLGGLGETVTISPRDTTDQTTAD